MRLLCSIKESWRSFTLWIFCLFCGSFKLANCWSLVCFEALVLIVSQEISKDPNIIIHWKVFSPGWHHSLLQFPLRLFRFQFRSLFSVALLGYLFSGGCFYWSFGKSLRCYLLVWYRWFRSLLVFSIILVFVTCNKIGKLDLESLGLHYTRHFFLSYFILFPVSLAVSLLHHLSNWFWKYGVDLSIGNTRWMKVLGTLLIFMEVIADVYCGIDST